MTMNTHLDRVTYPKTNHRPTRLGHGGTHHKFGGKLYMNEIEKNERQANNLQHNAANHRDWDFRINREAYFALAETISSH